MYALYNNFLNYMLKIKIVFVNAEPAFIKKTSHL